MIEAYPLCWPVGYKRTTSEAKTHAAFRASFAFARDGVIRQLEAMDATNIIISSNVPLKRDGLPYAVPYGSVNAVDNTGIAVYFDYQGETKVLACDRWMSLDDNMQAIHKTVHALRGIERWKVSEMMTRAFTGFKALPQSTQHSARPWWEVLGVFPDANAEQIKAAYKAKVQQFHPDKGGRHEDFVEVLEAFQKATNQQP